MRVIDSIPRDSIPSVDDPTFGDRYDGEPEDQVIVLDIGGVPARAYPTRYLDFHEVVNDTVGEDPIAVTWCPLCGTGIAYDRVLDSQRLTFGVSGKLANDNLVLYDRETESEWKQSTGGCIAGAFEGERLDFVPVAMMTWRSFTESYPDGDVLRPPGGRSISSGAGRDSEDIDYSNREFGPYFESESFGRDAFYDLIGREPDDHYRGPREWDNQAISPKEVVIGIEGEEEAVAVPTSTTGDHGVVRLDVDDGVVVFGTPDGLYAYADPGFEYEPAADRGTFLGDGSRWNGLTGEADDGRRLDRIHAVRAYAFTWADDHGEDAFVDVS